MNPADRAGGRHSSLCPSHPLFLTGALPTAVALPRNTVYRRNSLHNDQVRISKLGSTLLLFAHNTGRAQTRLIRLKSDGTWRRTNESLEGVNTQQSVDKPRSSILSPLAPPPLRQRQFSCAAYLQRRLSQLLRDLLARVYGPACEGSSAV